MIGEDCVILAGLV